MRRRAIIYTRVSTDDQADKGYSLPSQLDLCRKYAERLGYEIVAELREDISGATPMAERPEGKKLVAMVNARQADAIIAYQVDRLYRDHIELLIAVRMWLRAGMEVHTCDIGRIEDENNIVLLIKGWQGSDERKKIRERTLRGKQTKAQSGKVVVCGHAPYGYAFLRDTNGKVVSFEIVEEIGRIVRLIYRWYVHGDETGKRLSARGITRRLSEMRVTTPGELHLGYTRKRGAGIWNEQAVLQIIGNEVYAGVWRFGVLIGHTKSKRPPEEHFTVSVPAIIDHETWEHAQAQRKRNKEMARRNAKHDYLMHSLIRCACGAAMCGQHNQRRLYYGCVWQNNSARSFDRCDCHARWVRADAIEADVWGEIEELFSDLDRLWSDLKAAQQDELSKQEPKRLELEAIEANIVHTERKAMGLARTLGTLTDTDPDGVVAKSMQSEVDQTNTLYKDQVKRRAELQAELGAQRLTDDAIAEILQYARDVRDGIANANFDAKRRMLESLDVKVTVKDGRYYVKCVLGETEGEIRKIAKRTKGAIVPVSLGRR
jgi:site-specific DNA recombinase